jgi:hypothetical protein
MADDGRISTLELSKRIGVPKRTLLRWILNERFLRPERDKLGYYWWHQRDVEGYLKFIKKPYYERWMNYGKEKEN